MKAAKERLRRAKKTRSTIKRLGVTRVSIHKTNQHIYAQLIDPTGKVLAARSTLAKDFRDAHADMAKSDAAAWVGEQIARKAIELGVTTVAFDRSGFRYHGLVMKLADAARAAGLAF